MSCPLARANSAWILGDFECATGLPINTYRSLMSLLSPDLVALAEKPSPGNHQEIRIAPDIGRERGERRRHAHDLRGGGVEHLQARRTVEVERPDAAVGGQRDRVLQVAVEPAARRGGIVERADALDLGAPVLFVLRETVLGGARADEFLARALLVFLYLLVDLRLQPH